MFRGLVLKQMNKDVSSIKTHRHQCHRIPQASSHAVATRCQIHHSQTSTLGCQHLSLQPASFRWKAKNECWHSSSTSLPSLPFSSRPWDDQVTLIILLLEDWLDRLSNSVSEGSSVAVSNGSPTLWTFLLVNLPACRNACVCLIDGRRWWGSEKWHH